jgi:hypothetical protein
MGGEKRFVKTLFKIIICLSLGLVCTSTLANEWTCATAESYIPPATAMHPHIVQVGEKIDVIIWPADISKIELNPWDLVKNTVCFKGKGKPSPYQTGKMRIVVREKNQIKVIYKQ